METSVCDVTSMAMTSPDVGTPPPVISLTPKLERSAKLGFITTSQDNESQDLGSTRHALERSCDSSDCKLCSNVTRVKLCWLQGPERDATLREKQNMLTTRCSPRNRQVL